MPGLSEIATGVCFVLPGFLFSGGYQSQRPVRAPADFAWATSSTVMSVILFGFLGVLVMLSDGLLGLHTTSMAQLTSCWSFAVGLNVGGLLLGTAVGRLQSLWPGLHREVSSVLFGIGTTASADPWFNVLDPGEGGCHAYVVTTRGPNLYGAILQYSRDPESGSRELLVGPPTPWEGHAAHSGPMLLDDDLWQMTGGDSATATRYADKPVLVCGSGVVSVIVLDSCKANRRWYDPLARHWPWASAALYLLVWVLFSGALCVQ